MSRIRWHIPNRVLYFQPLARATLEDVEADNQELSRLLAEGIAPIYVLVDWSQLHIIPGDLTEIRQNNPIYTHDKIEHIILFGGGTALWFLGGMFADSIQKKAEIVDSYEDALALLERLGITNEP
jgi:hypothetical protein